MRNIFCLRQGRDEHVEVYYRIFEASISTVDLGKYNAATHMEINKDYSNGFDEDVTKRFQEMCLIMSTDS